MRWLIFPVLLFVTLAGCKVVLPGRNLAPVLAPRVWQSAHGSTNAPAADWWRQFGDARLSALVHEAMIRNPDLRATALRLEQARLRVAATGVRSPTLEATFNSNRQKNNFIGLPFGGGGVMTSRYTSHGLSLTSQWELDVWGRLKAGKRMATADAAAARANLWAARHSLAAQVVKAWVLLTEANEQLRLAGTNILILDTTVKQAELRYGLGVSPALDVRLARTNLETVRAIREQWQAAREESCRRLETLLGRYPTGFILGEQTLPDLLPEVPAGLPSDLLTRRPDVAASTALLLAAEAGVDEAQAELYPRLALTGSTGTSSDKLRNLLNSNFNVWSLGSNLAQSIFNGGKLRTNVRLREAQAAEAAFQHRQTVINAFGEVETALSNEAVLEARETHLARAADQAKKALALAEDRYSRGLEPFVTVLESQRRFTETRSQRVSARRVRLENRANLHLALGGDFLKPKGEDE